MRERDKLNRRLFVRFIDSQTTLDGTKGRSGRRARLVNNHPVKGKLAKQLRHWRKGQTELGFFDADRFLTALEVHLEEFFIFCDHRGKSPWKHGEPPEWHEEEFKIAA